MPQFWAQMIELDGEQNATCISCASTEDAAYSQVNHFLEMTDGEITVGVVRVWPFGGDLGQARVFGWEAQISMPEEQPGDLDEDEVEMEAEITLEERTA